MSRMSMIFQSNVNECSLACFTMILGFYRQPVRLIDMRRRFMPKDKPLTISELMNIATALTFQPRALRCETGDLNQVKLPCIMHWDFEHFVVLARVKRRSVIIYDPAAGIRKLTRRELAQHFTGVVLELTPSGNLGASVQKTMSSTRPKKFNYIGSISEMLPALSQLFLLTILLQLFSLTTPLYLQLVVDEVLVKHDVDFLLVLFLGFLGLNIITLTSRCLQELTGLYLSNRLSIQMANHLFTHLVRLPISYFQTKHMGDIISRFHSLSPIQEFVTSSVISLILNTVLIVITIVMLFLYSAWLTAIILASAIVLVVGKLFFYWPMRFRIHEQIVKHANLDSHFMESVRSISAIKRFNGESIRENDYLNRLVDVSNASVRVGYVELSYELFSNGIRSFLYLVIVYILAKEVLAQAFTIGMLYAFLAYFDRLMGAIELLTSEVLKALMLRLHLDRLAEITETPAEPVADRPPVIDTHAEHVLALEAASFAYDRLTVFRDLDLQITPGEHIAVIGPSGSGKTTLLKVCQGIIDLDDGIVRVQGQTLSSNNRSALGAIIASVMQEDTLITGSVMDNITFQSPSPNWDHAIECTKCVLLHDEILAHPLGYDRKIYEMDQSLSAGQSQRILLARALYQRPTILLLDEGTAHLDQQTATAVMQNITTLELTCIFSTHSMELLPLASRVLIADDPHWRIENSMFAD